MSRPSSAAPDQQRAGKVLVAVYAVFAIAATARAGCNSSRRFAEAPPPICCRLWPRVIYIVATVTLALGTRTSRHRRPGRDLDRAARRARRRHPQPRRPRGVPAGHRLVGLRMGYGFVPLVLPVLGLFWLWRTRPR